MPHQVLRGGAIAAPHPRRDAGVTARNTPPRQLPRQPPRAPPSHESQHECARAGDYFGIGVSGYPEAHPDVITEDKDQMEKNYWCACPLRRPWHCAANCACMLACPQRVVHGSSRCSPGSASRAAARPLKRTPRKQRHKACRHTRRRCRSDIHYLKEKLDAGADFVITQLFYDADLFIRYVHDCRSVGITAPIIPGIMPIMAYGGFSRMTAFCKTYVPQAICDKVESLKDDDAGLKEYGVALGVDMCKKILDAKVSPGAAPPQAALARCLASVGHFFARIAMYVHVFVFQSCVWFTGDDALAACRPAHVLTQPGQICGRDHRAIRPARHRGGAARAAVPRAHARAARGRAARVLEPAAQVVRAADAALVQVPGARVGGDQVRACRAPCAHIGMLLWQLQGHVWACGTVASTSAPPVGEQICKHSMPI
jgi:Methylenetetrahydrofolate reductase